MMTVNEPLILLQKKLHKAFGMKMITKMIIILMIIWVEVGNVGAQVALQPNCALIQPLPCTIVPDVDDNGQYTYTAYSEVCSSHVCVTIRPVMSPPPPYHPPLNWPPYTTPTPQVITYPPPPWATLLNVTYSPPPPPSGIIIHDTTPVQPPSRRPLPPTSEKYTSYGISQSSPWFCANFPRLNYTARVEANTGFPPGYKEDQFAACNYQNMIDLMSLGDCRFETTAATEMCVICLQAYQYWLCAISFPQCVKPAGMGPMAPGTNYTYRSAASIPLTNNENIISMIKPCRGFCFGVLQQCQSFMNFNCPVDDPRDYADWPNCNSLGIETLLINQELPINDYVIHPYR